MKPANPFLSDAGIAAEEVELVARAQQGQRHALEILITRRVVTACAGQPGPAEDASPDRIIGLERAVLDRWGKGDPSGFYEIMAAEESYFDPLTDARVDGLDALKAHIAPVYGKIRVERYEMLNPRVQANGRSSILIGRT